MGKHVTCISQRLTLQESHSLGKRICPTVGGTTVARITRCTFPNQLEAPLRLMRKIFWDLYILLAKKDVSPYIMATCWNFFNIFWDFHKMQKVDVIILFQGFKVK